MAENKNDFYHWFDKVVCVVGGPLIYSMVGLLAKHILNLPVSEEVSYSVGATIGLVAGALLAFVK